MFDRGGISKIRCLSARRYPDIEISVELSEAADAPPTWRYSLGIIQQSRGYRHALLTHEEVWQNGTQLLARPNSEDEKDELRLTQTHLEQINANVKFRDIAKFFESVLYLHLVPQLLRHPEAFTGPGIPGDPFGQSFLERVTKTQERTRRSRLKKIEEALRVAVPQLSQLGYIKDEVGVPHLEALYEHWRPHGAKQREDQFSDGTLRLLGLLWSLLEGDSPLLLEEPELSLNSGIVRKLAPLIYRLQRQKKRQVLVSTHSEHLLSNKGIRGDEVLLLTPNTEGTVVELACDVREVRFLLEGGFSIAEAAIPRTTPTDVGQLDLFK